MHGNDVRVGASNEKMESAHEKDPGGPVKSAHSTTLRASQVSVPSLGRARSIYDYVVKNYQLLPPGLEGHQAKFPGCRITRGDTGNTVGPHDSATAGEGW